MKGILIPSQKVCKIISINVKKNPTLQDILALSWRTSLFIGSKNMVEAVEKLISEE